MVVKHSSRVQASVDGRRIDPAYNIDSGDGDTNQARTRVDEADPYGTIFDHRI